MKQLFVVLKRILVTLIISVLIECFFFNFRYWESLIFTEPIKPQIKMSTGIEKVEPGYYQVKGTEAAYIEVSDINSKVYNLYFNPFLIDYPAHDERAKIDIRIQITDEGNENYLSLPDTEIIRGIEESKYIRLHTAGNTKTIRINLMNYSGGVFAITGLGINEVRPFVLREYRILIICLLGMLIDLFQPKSAFYRHRLNWKSSKQKMVIIAVLLLYLGIFLVIGRVFYDRNWRNTEWKASLQYNYLTEAILDGHAYLNIEPPEILESLVNPYDFSFRTSALNSEGESIIMDLAYKDGKYYSYFGITPVILFYIPYYLITGDYLSTEFLTILTTCVFIISCFWMWFELCKKYFPEVSIGTYLLLASVLVIGSEVSYCVQMPTLYSLPIILGLTLGAFGIAFWLRAVKENGDIRKVSLFLGSVCIALIAGCRPQLAIALLFSFPIFWKEIKERKFFSVKGFGNTVCVVLPFLLIGSWLLYYNYVRFGSIFDFGATYNLTGFDMTHRGFDAERFILGSFEYLFQPFQVSARYPFLSVVAGHMGLSSDFQGQVINEPLLGGFFAFNIIGFFLFGIRSVKQTLKEKNTLGITICSLIFGIVIVAVDIQMVGMTLRYLTDFSFFLMLSTVIIILCLLIKTKNNDENHTLLLRVVIFLTAVCVFTNFFTLLADGRYNSLREKNLYLFFRVKYELLSFLSIR